MDKNKADNRENNGALKTPCLVLDTSTDACTLALFLSPDQIFTFHEAGQSRHNQLLIPGIQDLLNQANIKPSDLQQVFFGHGPGSFTGTRISASLALGLSMGSGAACQAISSFELIAQGIYKNFNYKNILILQDAQKNQVYLAAYEFSDADDFVSPLEGETGLKTKSKDREGVIKTLIPPCLISPTEIPEKLNPFPPSISWAVNGNAWFLLQESLKKILPQIPQALIFNPYIENWQPRAEDGFELIQQDRIYPPEVCYLREASDWLVK